MQILRPVGRQASSRKYDLITALGVHACRADKHMQRLVLRFITAIVARYNWQTDELSIGQRELALLWSVDERTVKRDIAKLRALGWLVQKRAAVRGILSATEPDWPAVGPDFVDRLRGPDTPAPPPAPNVVAFPGLAPAPLGPTATAWDRALARLQSEDPAQYAMWYRQLAETAADGGILELAAPSRFHAAFVTTHHLPRLLAALRREDASFRLIKISAD